MESSFSRHTVVAITRRLIQFYCIIWPVKKSDIMCYLIYCVKFGYYCPLKSGLSRHTVLAIPQILIQFYCIIWPLKKSENMCYLIYCVRVWYFWQLKSGLSRYTVLAIPQILMQFFLLFDQWNNQTLCVSLFTVLKLGTFSHRK